MPQTTPNVPHAPPTPIVLPNLGPSVAHGFEWALFKFWYVIPIIIALAWLRAKMDRAEEKARTKRRARDWHEAQKEIREEEHRKNQANR